MANNSDKRPGEFDLIRDYFAPLADPAAGGLGLKDDAALLTPAPGMELVLTVDAIVEGVHYLPDDPPEDVAAKLLRVNLSDLAAKGAEPLGYLLTAMLAPAIGSGYMRRFVDGLAADQSAYGITLLGGDTVGTPGPTGFSLTAIGRVPAGTMRTRANAQAGDLICVSGSIGDGALGLLAAQGNLAGLSEPHLSHLLSRYRRPQPRVALGQALRELAHAGIDISDGLAADLGHLTVASGVGAHVRVVDVPLSDAARAVLDGRPDLFETVLTGGDDYELLLAVSPQNWEQAAAAAGEVGTPLTAIGRIEDEKTGLVFEAEDGRPLDLKRRGFTHN